MAFAGMTGGSEIDMTSSSERVSLRYEGSGKPLVLIHEMGGTMESWDLVMPPLSAKRRVVRYDTRGAGLSERSARPVTIDTMTDDLIALLDGLGITEEVALAGTAVGGAIALHTAFRFPQRVAAVIASSPAVSHPRGEPRSRARPRRALRARRFALRRSTPPPTTAIRPSCGRTRRSSRASARAGSRTIR